MDDLDLQSFQASVSRTEVDQVLRRIQGHPGVMALMLTNRDGLALRSNVDINTTKNYAVHYGKPDRKWPNPLCEIWTPKTSSTL